MCIDLCATGLEIIWNYIKIRRRNWSKSGHLMFIWIEIQLQREHLTFFGCFQATRFLIGSEQGVVLSVERKAKKDQSSQKSIRTIFGLDGGLHHGPVYSIAVSTFDGLRFERHLFRCLCCVFFCAKPKNFESDQKLSRKRKKHLGFENGVTWNLSWTKK